MLGKPISIQFIPKNYVINNTKTNKMREIKISLETATRWYNGTDTELRDLAVQTYPELLKKELPKSWEELKEINGYFVDIDSDIYDIKCNLNDSSVKNIFATKEQAEASIALAQLSQLMAVYNDGWVANWKAWKTKYSIIFDEDVIVICECFNHQRFLTLKDKETAKEFLKNFRSLILTAKPLL